MRIVAIREKTVRLAAATRNSSIAFDSMTATAIAVHTDTQRDGKPLVGVAFDSIGRYDHGGLLRDRFIPRLLAAEPERYAGERGGIEPHRAWNVLMTNEKPGGHGERCGAVGLLDAALWDLTAKHADAPLWRVLAERHNDRPAGATINVYASGGLYRPADDIERLRDDIRLAVAQGQRRFKIKIGGASLPADIERIEAVLAILKPGMTLAVDGNGAFDRATALATIEALAPYPLAWLEEPVHSLDYELHHDIAGQSPLPLATGENLFSADDARNLLRHGGLRPDRDVLQFDVSLSYGIPEYIRILDHMAAHGWGRDRCAPHAGHLFAMHAVAGLGLGMAEVAMDRETLFGTITAGIPIEDGRATLPDAPGVGFEASPAFQDLFSGLLN